MFKEDILASRLNFSVVVFRGHSRQELFWLSLVSWLLTATLLSVLTAVLCDQFLMGMGLSFPLAIPVGLLTTKLLQRIKMGKPKGYLKQWLLLQLAQQGLITLPWVDRSGCWSVRRGL